MQAVLNAIGSRVAQPGWWGHDIASVCLAETHGIHQFSCWNAADPNYHALQAVADNDPAFHTAWTLAVRLADGSLPDIVRGADSYFALGSDRPYWATWERFRCTRGRHAFYSVGVAGDGPIVLPTTVSASVAGAVAQVHH